MNLSFNGHDYEMPKYTIDVADKISAVYAAERTSVRDSYKAQYAFIVDTLGKTGAQEALEAASLKECDLNTVTILFMEIEKTLRKPVTEYNAEAAADGLSNPALQKVIDLGAGVKNISDMAAKAAK